MDYNGWKNRETWLLWVALYQDETAQDRFGKEVTAEDVEQESRRLVLRSQKNGFAFVVICDAINKVDWSALADYLNKCYEEDPRCGVVREEGWFQR